MILKPSGAKSTVNRIPKLPEPEPEPRPLPEPPPEPTPEPPPTDPIPPPLPAHGFEQEIVADSSADTAKLHEGT